MKVRELKQYLDRYEEDDDVVAMVEHVLDEMQCYTEYGELCVGEDTKRPSVIISVEEV